MDVPSIWVHEGPHNRKSKQDGDCKDSAKNESAKPAIMLLRKIMVIARSIGGAWGEL